MYTTLNHWTKWEAGTISTNEITKAIYLVHHAPTIFAYLPDAWAYEPCVGQFRIALAPVLRHFFPQGTEAFVLSAAKRGDRVSTIATMDAETPTDARSAIALVSRATFSLLVAQQELPTEFRNVYVLTSIGSNSGYACHLIFVGYRVSPPLPGICQVALHSEYPQGQWEVAALLPLRTSA
jgi:hypothetical protein